MERAVYKPMRSRKLAPRAGFTNPNTVQRVCADSPAIEVMTDLQRVSAATIAPDATLAEATQLMIARGVRLLFCVEKGSGLLGLITARDTMGERPIKLIQERGGSHGDLRVRDLMVPAGNIDVLDFQDVMRAEVGHIVATLKEFGRQHALVVDRDPLSGEEVVRGLFSATQIGRQLDIPLQPFEVARTFADIESRLAG
jgi:predicted transcriptional regulator